MITEPHNLDQLVEFACTQGSDPRHLRLVLGMFKLEEMKYEDPCGIAASYGNLTILALLRQHNVPWGGIHAKGGGEEPDSRQGVDV
jgi:hypothetical protein